jgi:SAM-dependent methyltransferase
MPLVPAGGPVLDLGCGNSVPGMRLLAESFDVTGVNNLTVQIARSRDLVPTAHFILADMAALDFPPASFDAIVAFFALIHLLLGKQPLMPNQMADWLAPGGVALLALSTAR